jgi:hypothetical protein
LHQPVVEKDESETRTMKNHTFHAIGTLVVLALTAIQGFTQTTYEPYTFTTLAGGGGYSTNFVGNAGRLNLPFGIATDSVGNVYVADQWSGTIRKVTPAGDVTELAGRAGSFGSVDGAGNAAQLEPPQGVAVDGAGNLYVGDNNNTIRKVTPDGTVTTLAGLAGTSGNANGPGSAARFNFLCGVAVDGATNVYVADAGNSLIRKMTAAGTNWVMTTLAGRAGVIGSVDGTNSAARFNWPQDLAVDSVGNIYVADTDNHTIRMVTPAGVVTTLAGRAGVFGFADGTNSSARFWEPKGIDVDSKGNIYVADNAHHTIRKVTPVGTNWVVTTIAGLQRKFGSADGIGNAARFAGPWDVAVDRTGQLYVADGANHLIRKMTLVETNWVVTTLAGLEGNYGSTNATGSKAQFAGPSGVAVDRGGNIYVADQINYTIRKISPEQEVTTLAGLAGYGGNASGTNSDARFWPNGLAVDSATNIYVADSWNNLIRKVRPDGTNWITTTLAGRPVVDWDNGGSEDGPGSNARFFHPMGVAVDRGDNVYVADALNSTIRKITPAGVVTTLAGSAGAFGSANGTGSAARFSFPSSVSVDSATNVYVADTWNHTIRKVTPARVVTTIAGLAGNAGANDGSRTAARFAYPSGIAVDLVGNLYVTDAYNNTVRKLTPIGTNWLVTTLGGMSDFFGTTDGTGNAARFGNPTGVAVDLAGNVYVADFYFNTIRKGYAPLKILNSGFTAGQFGFDISGPPGQSVVVEASLDLVDWLPAWTNTIGERTLIFSDPQKGVIPRRFYRARTP